MGRIKIVHRLEVDPFAEWLIKRVERFESQKAFASTVQEDFTWIGKVIDRKYKTVNIDKVDRILCRDGTTHLRELYPNIYEENDDKRN